MGALMWQDTPLLTRFYAWKSKCGVAFSTERDKRGRFKEYFMRTQWAAYRQGVRDILPEQAPEDVLQAMVGAGCREAWAKDIYKACREALLTGEPQC